MPAATVNDGRTLDSTLLNRRQHRVNDRMYDTLDQWYDPAENFTAEQPIRDTQALFAGDQLQLDPQSMIDFMVELIPQEHHKFRNVFPERFVEDVMQYQASLWSKEV